jgi:APA family basic amino acid/polyamine antiporter
VSLWATKPIATLQAEAAESGERSLKRTLGPINLVSLGVGGTIGAGIFVVTGQAAALHAGPAVAISMVLAGIACAFAGLCYAEMASIVPVAGSAYTYSYATMGELVAWIIGWDLVLEYAASGAAVAVGWSGHLVSLVGLAGIDLPASLSNAPTAWCTAGQAASAVAGCAHAGLNLTGALINLPAVFIVALTTAILVLGIRESSWANDFIVVVKVGIIFLIVAYGLTKIVPSNWEPFVPENSGEWGTFGWSGVLRGAGLVFFAFIGFDAVSTTAQEAKNPQRDMPIGILGSLVVCTILYVAVSAVLAGMLPYTQLNLPAPVAHAMEMTGAPYWLRASVDVAATLGLASVVLMTLLGQSRVFYSMGRDGLVGAWASEVHPKYRTPYIASIYTGIGTVLAAGFLPLGLLGELVSIGTLLAFALVCIGVIVLRRTRPDLERPFRTPGMPFVPIMGVLCCVGLMLTLPRDTWIRLVVWLAIGFAIYFGYGRKHSVLQRELASGAAGR